MIATKTYVQNFLQDQVRKYVDNRVEDRLITAEIALGIRSYHPHYPPLHYEMAPDTRKLKDRVIELEDTVQRLLDYLGVQKFTIPTKTVIGNPKGSPKE